MGALGWSLFMRLARAAVAAAGIAALAALRPVHPAQGAGAPSSRPVVSLTLSPQARRYLTLQYGAYSSEFMGCMIGEVSGTTVVVRRIAPADVDPRQSTETHVLSRGTCEAAGWSGTVGVIHSHPHGERCFYYFPGTRVATSDAQSFALQPYPVDAIMCGDSVVWIGRGLEQHSLLLVPQAATSGQSLQPGNRVREGSGQ